MLKHFRDLGAPDINELYNQDNLFGAEWHWRFEHGSVDNLGCLCPVCKNELIYDEIRDKYLFHTGGPPTSTVFICDNCKKIVTTLKGSKDDALGRVEREIWRKLRTGEWKSEIEQPNKDNEN